MPITRGLFQNETEFHEWADARAADTGATIDGRWTDDSSPLSGKLWFKDDWPKSYPVIAVFFWMERAGLIVDAWIEYVYPGDFA